MLYINTLKHYRSVIYKQKNLNDEGEVFIDQNLLPEDVSVGATVFTEDGSLCAYFVIKKGSDWNTIKVVDTSNKQNYKLFYLNLISSW